MERKREGRKEGVSERSKEPQGEEMKDPPPSFTSIIIPI